MRDDTCAFEKARWTDALGAINDLRGKDKVSWCDLLAQRSDCGEGKHRLHAEGFECCDVGACGDSGGVDGVARAVAGEESDLGTGWKGANGDGGARQAPWLQ